MNRHVRCLGINHDQVGDFEEVYPGEWRGVDMERSAGICIYTWEMLITRIADLIGAGHVYILEPYISIDRAGNIWLDHEYLAPHQYLPKLIPEKAGTDE
jgi:hypothetical protein